MVIASIDIMDNKAVQLRQGKEKILERNDPLSLAQDFDLYGEIAVIDLDAAKGLGNNRTLIQRICDRAECRVGGGIRTIKAARAVLEAGATKVIIGSRAFNDQGIDITFLKEIAQALGRKRLILAVDAVTGEIVTRAWTHRTGLMVEDTIAALEPFCGEFLFTCVEREGMLEGTDLVALKRVRERTQNKITLAGGVTTIDEVISCAKLGVNVQLGMALYTGVIDLGAAFIASLNWKTDLLPTIIQDKNGHVLMLAYSSKESLQKVFETRMMWYFSRSRKELWHKGSTSGNVQRVMKLRADCDQDAILARVCQEGAACHTGQYSCFDTYASDHKVEV